MVLLKLIKAQKSLSCLLIAAAVLSLFPFRAAFATTAFSRQTGEPCAACHMQSYGPWLTQYGQKFKLDGYVAGHANQLPDVINPFALEVVGSITNTQKDVPAGQYYPKSRPNNNAVNDWTSLFYTGRVAEKLGAYMQLNVNPQVAGTVSLTMADIRFANYFSWQGNHVNYGVTLNNYPGMSDFWMTSYAWMYPYNMSAVAVMPAAKPWMQNFVGWANLAGGTVYTMINNHLYLEGGAYASQSRYMAQGLGVWGLGSQSASPQAGLLDGGAPYWRMFLQNRSGPHTMMIGTFGLMAKVIPYYARGSGTDSYQEYNVDANYWYMMDDDNMLMLMARYTRDEMHMGASQQLYGSNSYNYLNSYMVMAMWTYRQTYNLTVGWNNMAGSADMALYNGALGYGGSANPITGSANGSPNTNSLMFQADYIPFGKGKFGTDPLINLRLSLQYTAYTQFNGGYTNYDGNGRSPEANNTLYFVGNLMF
ncbi:MAG: hypothetical protein ABSB19_15620 [Methylomonas sp.]